MSDPKIEYYVPYRMRNELKWMCRQYHQYQKMLNGIEKLNDTKYKVLHGKDLLDFVNNYPLQRDFLTTRIAIISDAAKNTINACNIQPNLYIKLLAAVTRGVSYEKLRERYKNFNISKEEFSALKYRYWYEIAELFMENEFWRIRKCLNHGRN